MPAILTDLRFGARALGRKPGFTVVSILVLALGIGANTAVFSVVNALLIRPLPGASAGTPLLGLYSKDTKAAGRYRAFSYPNLLDIREGARSFSSMTAYDLALAGATEGDRTRRTFVDIVCANYFETLGTTLARGRVFTVEEERPGHPSQVAIVSDAYWRTRGADPDILGRTVTLSGRPFTVIGVARPGFTGATSAIAPEFWVPLGASELVKNDFMREEAGSVPGARDTHELMVMGRLRAGVTPEAAGRELAQVAQRLEQAYPAENRNQTIVAASLPRMSISTAPNNDREIISVSVVLLGMSAVVLLVACLNLANMLLARGAARRREIAIRLSLGAGRIAVIRQLLAEGFLLALGGGALGTALAYGATVAFARSIVGLIPVPILLDTTPDWRVMAATLAFAALATLAFALGPAWRATKPAVLDDLKQQQSDERGRRARLLGARNLLLGSQMALSLALLVVGALFVRGALNAAKATPGFSFDRGILVEVDPSLAAYSGEQSAATHRNLLARLRAMPGVEAVSMASLVPFGAVQEGETIRRADGDAGGGKNAAERERVGATYTVISADYFRSLGLAPIGGRDFTPAEAEGDTSHAVVIIDEPLAKRLFPGQGENPVGRFVQISGRGPDQFQPPVEIVGVVAGFRDSLFDREPVPHIYVPFSAAKRAWLSYHIRLAAGAPSGAAVLQEVRREIRAFDERLPVLSMSTLRAFGERSVFLWIFRSAARILTAFGLAALLLALVGIYGVNAYVVATRTRELGIRMALGATAPSVVRLVLRDVAIVSLAGIAVGLLLAVALGRLVSSMLFEVSATDPLALTVAPVVLAVSALVASYLPARRATRVAPVVALRHE